MTTCECCGDLINDLAGLCEQCQECLNDFSKGGVEVYSDPEDYE